MGFDLSVASVVHWLQDDLPAADCIAETATTVDSQRSTKRRRLLSPRANRQSKRHRHRLLSPPSSATVPARSSTQSLEDVATEAERTGRAYTCSRRGASTDGAKQREAGVDSLEMSPTTPIRPSRKRPATDDTDQTPRASEASGSGRFAQSVPNLPSSSCSSRSNAADSLATSSTKRSRRSQSPTKLFPMYGPEGRQLVRDTLATSASTMAAMPAAAAAAAAATTATARGRVSPELRNLVGDLTDVAHAHAIMPRAIEKSLRDHLAATGQFERVYDYMFFDSNHGHHPSDTDSQSNDTAINFIQGGELVRRAARIAARSGDCSRLVRDEATWNNLVHTPILDIFACDMPDVAGSRSDVLDYMPCTLTDVDPMYHRFTEPASRVDYVLYLRPERDATSRCDTEERPDSGVSGGGAGPASPRCFNWTADSLLQQYPLAIGIETKSYGGNMVKAEAQLGLWHAAQWEFLTAHAGSSGSGSGSGAGSSNDNGNDSGKGNGNGNSSTGADASTSAMMQALGGFLPGIVVYGHTWSLLVTTRRAGVTTVMSSVEFGSTNSVVGVLQVLAGLRRLRRWVVEVLWPWYKEHLPGLGGECLMMG